MLKNTRTVFLVVSIAGLGCTGNGDSGGSSGPGTGGDRGDASGGTYAAPGGSTGSGGERSAGSGGTLASTGGATGTGGGSGGVGSGGVTASGGVSAPATGGIAGRGTVGTGGMGGGQGGGLGGGGLPGTGGNGTAGSSGPGGAPSGPAPTFTMIYDAIITPSCGGSACHLKRPYGGGLNFSNKSSAYQAWSDNVTPGDGDDSGMFQILYFGVMPLNQPSLPGDELLMVRDWINAGALDN